MVAKWWASWWAGWLARNQKHEDASMPLTAFGIKKAGDGRLGDGNGLSLYKKGEGGKWIWRYSLAGNRREMGLGTWPTVSLSDARRERDRWALTLSQGKDPSPNAMLQRRQHATR